MSDAAAAAVRAIVRDYGRTVIDDPLRVRAGRAGVVAVRTFGRRAAVV